MEINGDDRDGQPAWPRIIVTAQSSGRSGLTIAPSPAMHSNGWLLFALRRDVGFCDHAVFATYSLSFMSLGCIALALLGVLVAPAALTVAGVSIVPPLHMYRHFKGAYRLSRAGANSISTLI